MAKKKKNSKWIKPRHKFVRNLLCGLLKPYCKSKYHVKVEKFADQSDRQYLILSNHQTAFDQFFVGMAFRGSIYYVASEDLFSKGFVSKVIKHLVAPIPIKKQTTDVKAVLDCFRVAKEGGTICIFPEGNRTFSGKTEYINPAVVGLVQKLGLPLAIFRIEGGYGVHPRWSDVKRKGTMRAYVSNVIEPEDYKSLNKDEMLELIRSELYVNEAHANSIFRHKKRAEYLERAIYVCPKCGLSTFYSKGDTITCQKCGLSVRYGEDTALTSESEGFPFGFVNDWYDYQQDYVNALDVAAMTDAPIYEDTAKYSEVIVYKHKVRLQKKAQSRLYGDRIEISGKKIGTVVYRFDDVTAVTVLGKNKVNIYVNDRIYQLKADKRFNALRYVNLFYRYKNQTKGEENGQCKFLGL